MAACPECAQRCTHGVRFFPKRTLLPKTRAYPPLLLRPRLVGVRFLWDSSQSGRNQGAEWTPHPPPRTKVTPRGQKRPHTPNQVAVLKEVLSNLGRLRDLSLFGGIRSDFAILQRKTSRTLKVSLSDHTRTVVARYIQETGKASGDLQVSHETHPPAGFLSYGSLLTLRTLHLWIATIPPNGRPSCHLHSADAHNHRLGRPPPWNLSGPSLGVPVPPMPRLRRDIARLPITSLMASGCQPLLRGGGQLQTTV